MTSEVVILDGTFYSPENTAKNEYEFATISQKTSVADLDDLFLGPTEFKTRDWQAEIWVPNGIPVPAFTEVYFRNAEEREAAVAACTHIAPHLPKTIRFQLAPHWLRF